MKLIKNADLYGERVFIVCDGDKIASVSTDMPVGEYDSVLDLDGARIFAGLIDIHTHGAMGLDAMDGDSLDLLGEYYLANGTTTWYPTTMTMSMEDIEAAVNAVYGTKGANLGGFHLEGPFINPKRCGAQDPKHALTPTMELFERIGKRAALITVAPEIDGAIDFIKNCPIKVAIGHTTTDYDTAMLAIDAGADSLTHTFNAMPSIHHRAPGPIVAGADGGAYAQLICDGIHVHPGAVRMLITLYGTDRVILISDSISATGLPDGDYVLGGLAARMSGGIVTLPDGTLAGSSVSLLECVRRAISFGISERDAFKMASENPARYMGLNKGVIAEGYDADFIVLDSDLNLVRSIVRGEF